MPRRPRLRFAALAAGAAVSAAAALGLATASAATPAEVTVGAPGSGAPAKATYTGSPVVGNDDPVGPPAPACLAGQCDRETVHLKAPSGYVSGHVLTLQVKVTFDGTAAGNTLDVAILDRSNNPLGSSTGIANGGTVAVRDVPAGDYVVEVDGDIAATPTAYSAAVSVASAPRTKQKAAALGKVRFSRETVADPFRLGTEPNIAVAGDGRTVYESPIFGFSTTQSFLQRSDNGGRTFKTLGLPGVGKLDQCTGGGDSDVSTDQYSGDVYMIDLGGAPEVPARVSHDRGQTFASSCEANFHDGANYFTDRQWLTTDLVHHQEYFIYRDGVITPPGGLGVGGVDASRQGYGEYIKTAPLAAGPGQAGAAQLAFVNMCTQPGGVATPCILDVTIAGNAVTDNAIGHSRFAGTTYLAMGGAKGIGVAVINPDNKSHPIIERAIPGNHHGILFPTVAVDRAGRIYETWVDSTTAQVQFASSPDQGKTWTAVSTVNGAPAATTVMPWIVAGDSGRVDIAFYGTANSAPPTTNYGPWFGYLAQTLDGTSARPHFTQVRFTDRPNHIDPVCLSGLGCTTNTGPGGDRELGDFFRVVVDRDGRALISFADGDNQLGQEVANGPLAAPSFAHFVRQVGGPSLYTSVGTVPSEALPTNGVALADHSAPLPLSMPGTGAYGSDAAALNLRSSTTAVAPDGTVRIHLKVKDLSAALPPAAGAQVKTFLTRWISHDHVYFAAAEISGGVARFFGGQAQPVSDGLAIKYAYYPAATALGGTVDGNDISITAPPGAVGNPTPRDTLYSVTTWALARTAPTAPTPPAASNVFDFPQVADVLPSYNVVGGGSAKAPPPLKGGTTGFWAAGWLSSGTDLGRGGLVVTLALCSLACARSALRLGRTGPRPVLAR